MKYLRIICRVLLGLVFVFSGFVKGVDPMGSAIKFNDYFEVFHMSWLGSFAMILSVLLSTAEFLIGIALVIGLRMRVTAWAALLFMGFFTVLTLYSAIFNPVTDCGCFGDAIKITNWQTFYKNIILSGLAIFIFISAKKYKPYSKPMAEWIFVGAFAAFGVGISVYSNNHLPIFDFRPYKVGTHIPSQMIIPEGAEQPIYNTTLYYEKNGIVKEFDMNNYPWQDSTWKFKDQKSVLVSEGYVPPIHNFSLTSKIGEDITPAVLKDTSVSFLFITHKIEKIGKAEWVKIVNYSKFTAAHGYKFYVLTGATQTSTDSIQKKYKLPFEFYSTDQTTLKTIVRANPGLMILKDGIVLGLYHYNDFPDSTYFKGNIPSTLITAYHRDIEWKRIVVLGLIVLLIITGIFFTRK